MKKINIYFVLECVIIVLLLAILGVLLKNNGNSEENFVGEVWEEDYQEEVGEITTEVVSGAAEENENSELLLQKSEAIITDIVISQENKVGDDNLPEVLEVSVSDNNGETGKFLNGKKIVVFGDSLWDEGRGTDGISEHIQNETGATVYNCAVGGSTAALVSGENTIQNWSSSCFNGMVYVARDLVSAERVIPGRDACEVVGKVNFEEMDYVIISYGLNDFFSNIPIYPEIYYDITSYAGALRNGINKLKENYSHLKIILVSPTYTVLFEGEQQFEIGEYVEAARNVANEMNVHFLDMFHVLGEDAETRTKHLVDGVHLSTAGRKTYADAVIWELRLIAE